MGKGDQKSRRGKISIGTYGVRRPRKKSKTIIPTTKAKPAVEKAKKPIVEKIEKKTEEKTVKTEKKTTKKAAPKAKKEE